MISKTQTNPRATPALILEYLDYMRALVKELDSTPVRIAIASFNVHVGISARGGVFRNDTHRLLEHVNEMNVDSRIMVGVGPTNGAELPNRLTNCAEFFRNISWRTRLNCHLKCWIFHRRSGEVKAIIGGRNLGDSEWADASCWLEHTDSKRLLRFYDTLWNDASPVKVSKMKLRVSGRAV